MVKVRAIIMATVFRNGASVAENFGAVTARPNRECAGTRSPKDVVPA